jgi:hypothetical protein
LIGEDLEGFRESEEADLPPDTQHASYALKASLSIALVSAR